MKFRKNNSKQDKFMALYAPVQDNLWRYCLALTYSRADAKELMSETIAAAYQSLESLKTDAAFLSYLFTICKRLFFRNIQSNKRFEIMETEYFDLYQSQEISPDKAMEIKELYDALEKLPFEQKEAIILFDIMGYSRDEIAEIQGSNIENVKARLYRGRKKLAEILKAENDLITDTKELIYG